MKNSSYQHLTLEQRIEIQQCLGHGMSFKDIAKRINKHQTTVSREVKRHLIVRPTTVSRSSKAGATRTEPCPHLLKSPFVCNPCQRYHRTCSFDKFVYVAKDAQRAYETDLRESREGIPLNKEAFYENDRIITEGIRNGQHLYHILKTNDLSVSLPTVYRHLKKGYLSVSTVDLPRAPKFKPRAKPYSVYVPKASKIGRTYADFTVFKEQNDCTSWVEMDTVIGRVGGKVILTLTFTSCNFMLGFLLPDKSATAVSTAVRALKELLHEHDRSFGSVFPVLLTDNGGEFANVAAVENDLSGNKESQLFFCDPLQAAQKPHVEKNHTLFRDIVPKGESFDGFSQETVNLVFSHINSVKRKALNGRSSWELFAFTYGEDLPALLGIDRIPPQSVVQSPSLLKAK